jgi:hypothetical protein
VVKRAKPIAKSARFIFFANLIRFQLAAGMAEDLARAYGLLVILPTERAGFVN